MSAMGAGMMSSAPQGSGVTWTTPAGWTEKPASGMRVGSFLISKDGQQADVSIIPLGGPSGGDLANLNRWRGQIGLEPIDEAKATAAAERVTIGHQSAPLYDLAGTDPKSKQPARILGSLLAADGTTWFFKMLGNDALVEQQKPAFIEFLKSIKFQSAPAMAQSPPASGPLSTNPKQISSGPMVPEPAADKPAWEVPAGWQEQPPSVMRLASYTVGGENGKADVSVIKLGGPAGGILANVNRWRSQVGLPPVDDAGLEKLLTSKEVGGVKITSVDMAGPSPESGRQSRLLAAIVPRGEVTWFYKMLGDDQLVAAQKAAFTKFVESARYPNAS